MKSKYTIWIGLVIILVAPILITDFSNRNSIVDSCERINQGIREPLFNFLTDAITTRNLTAENSSGDEKQINVRAAEKYQSIADKMVESSGQFKLYNNRPEVDCDEAFPKPFPFNVF